MRIPKETAVMTKVTTTAETALFRYPANPIGRRGKAIFI